MARRALQLAAALALLVSMLGVSTALIAEVREEVLSASPAEPSFELSPPEDESTGFPIREFTILEDTQATIPDRRLTGNVLQVTAPGSLWLEQGDRIRAAPIPLGPQATVGLPEGGHYRAGQLDCPDGCIVTDANRTIPTPPNATLLLRPGAQLDTGVGPVPAGTELTLPEGTRLALAPLTISRATTIPLGPGSTIVLPTNDQASFSPAQGASRVALPAFSVVRGASNDTLNASDLEGLAGGSDGPPTERRGVTSEAIRPDIEVTRVPDTIEKGRPFQVAGYVDLPNGEPSVGHRVTIYANETKSEPGFEIQLGNVQTREDGTFEATASIPRDKPTRPYHIVAQAHAQPDSDPALLEAWSDPVVGVQGDTELNLDLPRRAGIRVPVALQAVLTDTYGAPVPDQPIRFDIQGTSNSFIARTDETGRAIAIAPDGLPFPGNWTIRAVFDGTQNITGSQAEGYIDAVDARIVTPPRLVAARGENATVTGTVEVDGSPAEDIALTARFAGSTLETRTTGNGSFELEVPVPTSLALGNHTLVLTTDRVTAERTILVTVTGRAELSAVAPAIAPVGGVLPVDVEATTESGDPAAGLQVIATTPDGDRSQGTTDANGVTRIGVPLTSAGDWTIDLRTPGGALLTSATGSLSTQVGNLAVLGDARSTVGRAENVSLGLQVDGRPLPNEPVELSGPGFAASGSTDDQGEVELGLTVPPGTRTGGHDATLTLPRFKLAQIEPFVVLDRPSIEVQIVSHGYEGDPVVLEAQARGQDGEALPDLPLTAEARGAFETTLSAFTDEEGRARFEIERPRGADGLTAITVRAQQTDTTGTAVGVASAEVTPAPFPWWTLLLVIPLGLGGLVYLLRRRDTEDAPPEPGPTIELDIGPSGGVVPPVWHPGEPTRLTIQLVDEDEHPLPERTVHLTGPQGEATIQLDPDGRAMVPIPASDEGPLTYTARFEGDGQNPPTETTLDLRLVDYREEIDREYRDLREQASEQDLCGPDATPHELARALGGGRRAKRLALLFERCDYSPHHVRRSHYERFMRDKEACLPDGHGPD